VDYTFTLVNVLNKVVAPVTALTEAFDAVTNTFKLPLTDLLVNTDITNHPDTGCSLMAAGCSGVYSGGKFTIDPTTPWQITLNRNVVAGYVDTFCVQCTTALETTNSDDFTYTLINYLKQKSGALITLTEGFDAVTNTLKNPTDLIENTDSTATYPTTGCIL
jgi:hypothetical protein